MFSKHTQLLRAVTIALVAPAAAAADDQSFQLSGFMSVTAGAVLSGDYDQRLAYNPQIQCPCAITDWTYNGVYEGSSWTAKPDTKAGLQLTWNITDQLGFTTQVVSRATEPQPDVQWAYMSYKFADHWELDLGRKRIPLYFYSDFQDVGFAYPWITPPSEVYGWESTNYNGASVSHSMKWGGADARASVFGGRETVKHNPYVENYYTENTNTNWDNIVGTDLEVSKDWWTVRAVYVQADIRFNDRMWQTKDHSQMQAYGLAFNGDFGDWFFVSEIGQNNRKDTDWPDYSRIKAPAYSVGVGYRFADRWTALVNTSGFRERSNDPAYEYFRYRSNTVGLRYDLTSKSDIKVQFDKHDDKSDNFTGDSDLLRVSYDMVF